MSLVPIAVLGFLSNFLLPAYNPMYAVSLIVWTLAYKHSWERRERDLAVRWGTKRFTQLVEQRRAAYVTEGERTDPVTGERRGWFPLYVTPLHCVDLQVEETIASKLANPVCACCGDGTCCCADHDICRGGLYE